MPKEISPPWMEGAKDVDGHKMIVVHMNDGELEGLDNLQHGVSIDPETGIREYSALAEIIEIPQVRAIFHQVNDDIEQKGDVSPEVKTLYDYAKKKDPHYSETPDEKHDPLKALEHTGRGGDTKLALIPMNLAEFLIELRHEPSVNPETGLLEFGFFKKLKNPFKGIGHALKGIGHKARGLGHSILKNPIRTAGTVAGAFLGGPMGAGIGNALGSKLSGNSWRKSLGTGAMVGLGAYGAQGLGQAAGLSGATPYTGGFFGGGPNLLAQGLGKVGIGAAKLPMGGAYRGPYSPDFNPPGADVHSGMGGYGSAMTGAGAGMAASNMMGRSQQTGMNSGDAYHQPASWWDNILSSLTSAQGIGALGQLGLAYKGNEYEKKKEKKHKKEYEEKLRREKENSLGEYIPLHMSHKRRNPNFHNQDELESEYGIFREPYYLYEGEPGYAKGGRVKSTNTNRLIKGTGKGQDDTVERSVPEGTYIVDASSTSMFGDGSSDAGGEILRNFEKEITKNFPKKGMLKIKKTRNVPVWLSRGEYPISSRTVSILGKGSNDRGADMLDKMVIHLRKHKMSNGDGLPPKAKSPHFYI